MIWDKGFQTSMHQDHLEFPLQQRLLDPQLQSFSSNSSEVVRPENLHFKSSHMIPMLLAQGTTL